LAISNFFDSMMSYLKELPIISVELQFVFFVRILKFCYEDLNRVLLLQGHKVKEEIIIELRSCLRTLQRVTVDNDNYSGLCVLFFLSTLYVYML
jgi:hypothetical protein